MAAQIILTDSKSREVIRKQVDFEIVSAKFEAYNSTSDAFGSLNGVGKCDAVDGCSNDLFLVDVILTNSS